MLRTAFNTLRLTRIAIILAKNKVFFFWKGPKNKAKGDRLVRALEEMGPTFVKLGQALSTRSDLVGEDIALSLSALQDKLPPFATPIVKSIIEEQLGKPIPELFKHFEEQSAAAASISQVHFAVLHNGKHVAVKVLRPRTEELFAKDIALFYWLASIVESLKPEWKRFKLVEVVKMFEETILMELDLRYEAASAVQLKTNLRNDEGFYVPDIYWEYTAERVLTLERIYGIPIGDVAALKKAGYDLNRLVDIAAISFFNQVFRDGFFHADLHPGNLFVLPNSTLAVIDFGIMGRLDHKNRIYLAQILKGFLSEDYYNLAKVHFDAGYVPAHKSVENFALALMALTKPIIGHKLSEISVAKLLGQLFTTAETFEMEVQPHLLLLQKNMMISEGVGRMLNPDVNMWQVAEPLIQQWARSNMGPKAQFKEHAGDALSLLKTLPALIKQTEAVLDKVNNGGVKLHPDTLALIQAQRGQSGKKWVIFSWVALLVVALSIITR